MQIPSAVLNILQSLHQAGFDAYIVGGCVRDLLLKTAPKDWDVSTGARPEQIQEIFPDSVYENQFGTVLIKTDSPDKSLKTVEATTFRKEGKYRDQRHPEKIEFARTIEEDLSRRDFTVNAMALKINLPVSAAEKNGIYSIKNTEYALIDPFQGQKDLKSKTIRAVGNPAERFAEDALRLMRAIRFACELDFRIEPATLQAIRQNAHSLSVISRERVRDELIKIMKSPRAAQGILLLQENNLLKEIMPELEKGIGVTQNKHHIYTVWEHSWRSLQYADQKEFSWEVKLASLLHDIGKPDTKEGEGKDSTFYNHEMRGAKMAAIILRRLKFSKDQEERIVKLVRHHQFVYDPEITTDAAIRRLLVKVGKDNINELAQVREADRIGSGCPKALPFRLRHFLFRVEKVLQELAGEQPSLKILKINGNDIIKELGIDPGPQVGRILNVLLEQVLDNPPDNNKKYLIAAAKKLNELSAPELQKREKNAKKKYEHLLEEEEKKIKKKYYVD